MSVLNSDGLRVKVPANATPHGIGGAAGFHSEDDSFGSLARALAGQAETYAAAKASAQDMLFAAWIRSDETTDGWSLTYESAPAAA